MQGGRLEGDELRQVARDGGRWRPAENHLQRRGRRGRGEGGPAGDRGVPKNPEKFQALGARIPKGVLLVGPPEPARRCWRAPSPARRACRSSPSAAPSSSRCSSASARRACAISSSRRSRTRPASSSSTRSTPSAGSAARGIGGGNDEREQTLNQLLVEMDGFERKDGVIVIAATNRPDILDPALLRPGRFDRQVVVDRPDRIGRRRSSRCTRKGKPLAPDVDLDTVAARHAGLLGADLANLVNEAALLAARRGKKVIEQEDLEEAMERMIAGPEKKTRVLASARERSSPTTSRPRARGRSSSNGDGVHRVCDHSARSCPRLHAPAPDGGPVPDDQGRAPGTNSALILGGRVAGGIRFQRGLDRRPRTTSQGHRARRRR